MSDYEIFFHIDKFSSTLSLYNGFASNLGYRLDSNILAKTDFISITEKASDIMDRERYLSRYISQVIAAVYDFLKEQEVNISNIYIYVALDSSPSNDNPNLVIKFIIKIPYNKLLKLWSEVSKIAEKLVPDRYLNRLYIVLDNE